MTNQPAPDATQPAPAGSSSASAPAPSTPAPAAPAPAAPASGTPAPTSTPAATPLRHPALDAGSIDAKRRSATTPSDPSTLAAPAPLADLPVAGTGIDIVEIERMERAIKRTPRIVWRLFSAQEQAYCNGKARPATHYALFFAAKEAVLKALGTGFAGMAFRDVEVAHDRFGRPVPVLHGHAQEVAAAQGVVELQLSLSYTHQVGVASAVAIKQEDRPRKDEAPDPHAELARQFKQLRALLDDMDERLASLTDEPPSSAQSTEQ